MSANPGNLANAAVADAIKDLPAKPRVHELAKRSGLSSKEMIAALAERGVVVKAANSAVAQDDAIALLTGLLGGATDEPQPEPPEPVAEVPAGAVPLFLEADKPPAKRPRTRRKPAAVAEPESDGPSGDSPANDVAEQDGADQDGADQHSADKPAPRRTRSRKPAAKDAGKDSAKSAESSADGAAAETATGSAAAESSSGSSGQPDPDKPAGRTRSRRGRKVDSAEPTGDPEVPAADTDTSESAAGGATDDSGAAEQTDSGDDQSDSSGRRRRRRGRRGRGRTDDSADTTDTPEDGAAGTDKATDGADTATDKPDDKQGSAKQGGKNRSGGTGESDESEAQSDADDESSGGSRRRRRRRRRGGSGSGDDSGRDDDPDNTVVHVRDARSAESEVQGIKGSTRLEAKRQRRRDSRDSRRRPQILSEAEFLARRESVDRVMAVRQRDDLAQVALLEDDVLVEHFVSRAGSASMIGNIYLGKVQNVLPSMEAAFVDIGRGRNAVLYAGEVNWDASGLQGKARRIETALSSGDTVLAQVSKDPIGHKGARLTTQISLPGRFLVYVPNGGATGISRKLPDTERKRLKGILDRIVPDDAGVIIRTAAEGVAEEELARDVERLRRQWEEIKAASEPSKDGSKKAKQPTAPQQLSAEPDTLIKVIRDLFNSDIKQLVIDDGGTGDAWESVSGYVNQVAPELADRVTQYSGANGDKGDVFTKYRIDEQIHKALERKVHLPSGGSLVIDRTEAMTVVDVNTGKYTGSGGNLEETVTKNNLEAAEEIVRQLRLRDIGGIIVVDFIDMVLESNRDLVLRRLTECLGRDRTRHQVAEVTSLGLVQMTRKRMGTGLVEAFSETCEHCHGRGLMLRDAPIDNSGGGSGNGSGEQRPSGKKRRDRKRGGSDEPAAEPIARISTSRGATPPSLRPGAPVRSSVAAEVAAPADGADSAPTPGEVTADDQQTSDEVSTAVIAVTGADGELQIRLAEPAAAAGKADTAGAGTGGNSGVTASEPTPEPEPAPQRPRRRRAASRPAGPAGSAEPVLVPATGQSDPTKSGGAG